MEGTGGTATRADYSYSRTAPQKLTVADGDVVVMGPDGYCIDRPAARDGGATAFVLLASCRALTRKGNAPQPRVQALLTASITGATPAGAGLASQQGRMKSFFSSEAGRAALARDGRAESVKISEMFASNGAFFIRASDSSEGVAPGLSSSYWRAIFDVNGRMVTASVVPFADRPISDDAGKSILLNFTGRIQAASTAVVAAEPS